MAFLYSIQPNGLGTRDVESLSSYLIRLAGAHSTTVGTLLSYLDKPTAGYKLWHQTACRTPLSAFVRPNRTTAELVTRLSLASDVPIESLRSMTLLSTDGALKRSVNVFSNHLRWCGTCLFEQVHNGLDPYIRLVWLFNGVKGCAVHRCVLRDSCENCGATQERDNFARLVGKCVHCNSSLALIEKPGAEFDSWRSSASTLENFVEYIAENPAITFPVRGGHHLVASLYDEAFAAGNWEEFARSLPESTYPGLIYNPDFPLTFSSAVALSQSLGLSLEQVLLGSMESTNRTLPFAPPNTLISTSRSKRKRTCGREKLKVKIESYLKSLPEHATPSLRSAATSANVSVGALRHLLPGLSRSIVDMRKERIAANKDERIRELRKKLQNMLHSSDVSHVSMSRKGLLRELMNSNICSKNEVRAEVRRALESPPDIDRRSAGGYANEKR